jgi:hypothetical protein
LQVGHYYGAASAYAAGAQRRVALLRTLGSNGDGEREVTGVVVPRWLRAFLRAVRWMAVTPPTYLFWHALSVEMGASCAWRRLLLPCLLFAVQECGQYLRLIILLLVHEGYRLHEHLRKR